LKAGLAETRQRLKDGLDGMKRGLESDYQVSKAKYDQLEIELAAVRKSDIESERERYLPYTRSERNLENQRAIMTALKAKLAQQGIEVEIPRTPVEVVDQAEPNAVPVSPNLFLNIIISVVVGFGAGIVLAYFLEYLDTSIKTVDDVEKSLGLPVLGAIPQKVKTLNQEGPDSPHAEAYRILRANMQFANKGGGSAFAPGGRREAQSRHPATSRQARQQLRLLRELREQPHAVNQYPASVGAAGFEPTSIPTKGEP
ncbi:MAG: GNVR domain-containing protein, partial [candidate division NC10 bacterium]